MINAIIVAAGTGQRGGLGYNKLLFEFDGMPIIEHTIRAVAKVADEIVIVSHKDDMKIMQDIATRYNSVVITGGNSRTESVRKGLEYLQSNAKSDDIVIVHNGANPFTSEGVFLDSIRCAKETGSGIAVFKAVDSLRQIADNDTSTPINRDKVVHVQTPQTFNLKKLIEAYNNTDKDYSDDAQVYENHWGSVTLSKGERNNIKITTTDDIESLNNRNIRIGNGYDTHKLVTGRKLILGGVEIPHTKGLLGHSDADVLIHAIVDALLSAIGLGDIGTHFPDTDPKNKDLSSMKFLSFALKKIHEHGYDITNVTATLLAQKPKLFPFVQAITKNLATALNIKESDFGLTVTTTEGLGFVGREEGIACYCTCLLRRRLQNTPPHSPS